MYDKSVRRRRITLALLVASSLLLLTVYFGESAGGGLHSVQKGVLEVVSPIQEGASRALKPVRDLAGWFGDTLDAKNDVEKLRDQNAKLRAAAVAGTEAVRQNRQLQGLLGLDKSSALDSDARPVSARVIGQSPTIWYSTIQIDKGTSAGVRAGQPVITADGLAGQVTFAAPGSAVVTLITDGDIAVSARVSENGVPGVIETGPGGPRDLRMKYLDAQRPRRRGHDRRHRRHDVGVRQAAVRLPAGDPDRRGDERRGRRAPTRRSRTCARSPTCGGSSSCRS